MKINIALLIAAILSLTLFSVSCGSDVPASPTYLGTSLAAEDENYVYFIDGGRLYIFDRASGEVESLTLEADLLELSEDTLYLYKVNPSAAEPVFYTISRDALTAEPSDWRQNADSHALFCYSSEMKIYGERLAFACNDCMGQISSVGLDFTGAEDFTEYGRYPVGYEDGEYYYLRVEPSCVIGSNDELADFDRENYRIDLYLERGDTRLYLLTSRTCGDYSYNKSCTIYGGYIYYCEGGSVLRRRLSRTSSAEVIYSGYEENRFYEGSQIPLAYAADEGFEFHIMARVTPFADSNLLAVTARGVYVRDNAGKITLISHEGIISECGHIFDSADCYYAGEIDGNNRYFVSSVDGNLKYVNSSGGYGIVE